MMWALVLLIAVIVGVQWWEYNRNIQEYTFAQPTTLDGDLRGVLSEKTPFTIEVGELPWRPEVAEKSTWSVKSDDVSTPITTWLTQNPRPTMTNNRALAEEIGLGTGLSEIEESRAWWWLPALWDAQVDILEPGQVAGLRWVSAEREWVGCSHGGPLTLWLVHSRYRRYVPDPTKHEEPIDPWSLTAKEAPWIGRVHYVEVTVRPGWVIGIPAHWGFAVRPTGSDAAWWWSATQHSPMSLLMTHTA